MNEIARLALHGGESNDQEIMEICLEKIFIMATSGAPEKEASQIVMRRRNARHSDFVSMAEEDHERMTKKYGKESGYPKFKLALDFFQMSNDAFFELYGFNFVPKGNLYDEARKYITEAQAAMSSNKQIASGGFQAFRVPAEVDISGQILSNGNNISESKLDTLYKNTMRMGV